MLVLQSLWDRHRPGRDPLAQQICYGQWTPIHLTTTQRTSGIIPLRHIAYVLGVERPEGPTWVYKGGKRYLAQRINDCLVVPPGVLEHAMVSIKLFGEGFTLTHERPNLMATTQFITALRQVGYDLEHDPMDPTGRAIIPALLRATKVDPTLRHLPTLPLALVQSMQSLQMDITYR